MRIHPFANVRLVKLDACNVLVMDLVSVHHAKILQQQFFIKYMEKLNALQVVEHFTLETSLLTNVYRVIKAAKLAKMKQIIVHRVKILQG